MSKMKEYKARLETMADVETCPECSGMGYTDYTPSEGYTNCEDCGGFGYLANGYPICPDCEGSGEYMTMHNYGNGPVERIEQCPVCCGYGNIERKITKCECGIDASGSQGKHSDYCPKAVK